jgi:Flp pilus assembly protein TadB
MKKLITIVNILLIITILSSCSTSVKKNKDIKKTRISKTLTKKTSFYYNKDGKVYKKQVEVIRDITTETKLKKIKEKKEVKGNITETLKLIIVICVLILIFYIITIIKT